MTYEEFTSVAVNCGASSTEKRNYQTFIADYQCANKSIVIMVIYKPNLKDVIRKIVVTVVRGQIDTRDETLELFTRLLVAALNFRDYLKGQL